MRNGASPRILHKTATLVSRLVPAIPFISRGPLRGMNVHTENWLEPSNASCKTTFEAVQRQVAAMGVELFEVGLYKADAGATEASMIPRVWDVQTILKSVPWLRHQNCAGRNVYIRPKGEHDLSLVDDLTKDALMSMKVTGFNPAIIVGTSPGNYQAWLKHPEQLGKEGEREEGRASTVKKAAGPAAVDGVSLV